MAAALTIGVMRRIIIVSVCGWLTSVLNPATPSHAQDAASRSGMIKAALVYNVIRFTRWDEGDLRSSKLRICSIGDDEIARALPATFRGKEVGGRAIEVQILPASSTPHRPAVENCQVVYYSSQVNRLEREKLAHQLLGRGGILTVCSDPVLEATWCMVDLFEESNRARLAINRDVAQRGNVHFSAELLQFAAAVAPPAETTTHSKVP